MKKSINLLVMVIMTIMLSGCITTDEPIIDSSKASILPITTGFYQDSANSVSYIKVINERVGIRVTPGGVEPSEIVGIQLYERMYLFQESNTITKTAWYYLVSTPKNDLNAIVSIPSCNRKDVVSVFARLGIETSGSGTNCTLRGATMEGLVRAYSVFAKNGFVDDEKVTSMKFVGFAEGKEKFDAALRRR